jgi:hypothetical protein
MRLAPLQAAIPLMRTLRTNLVFVPGGMPQHTYVARTERELEQKLRGVADNLCKLATLTGSTKSGKTVLANRIFPRTSGDNVWIDGGTVKTESDLWGQILSELGGHTASEVSQVAESTQSASGGIGGGIKIPLVASGSGKIDVSASRKAGTGDKKSITLAPRPAAIAQLRESGKPLIIDDFHYLDRKFQGEVVRALKPLVFEGHPVVIIAIPHRRYDAVKVEREMTGRVESIAVPAWSAAELGEIPKTGFPLLNLEISSKVSQALAQEAYGSPHLMQEFCRGICRRENVDETVEVHRTVPFVHEDLFKAIAEGTGKVIFDKLAKGPRQRSDRKPRPLQAGGEADIYKVVLLALAKIAPGMERVEYESLRAAIKATLSSEVPQAHEVSRVLEKMAEIASSDEASTPVIDWDKEDQQLHVTDPFFAFFLKWGALGTP